MHQDDQTPFDPAAGAEAHLRELGATLGRDGVLQAALDELTCALDLTVDEAMRQLRQTARERGVSLLAAARTTVATPAPDEPGTSD